MREAVTPEREDVRPETQDARPETQVAKPDLSARKDVLEDTALNEILAAIPGATVVDIKENRK